MKEEEIGRLGIFEIAERKESYKGGDLDIQITAHAVDGDGATLALFLTEDEATEYEDQGRSLAAGSHIEVALLWPKGA